MKFYPFDAAYVQRLRKGDVETEDHFARYFHELLYLKLRTRPLARDSIDDVRQETLLRALIYLRKQGMRHPERLGAFVNRVCNIVLQEFYRKSLRDRLGDEDPEEPADPGADPGQALVTSETRRMVHGVLNRLPKKDRDILRAVYIQELDPDGMRRIYRKTPGYVRVRVHRAKKGFRKVYLRAVPHPPLGLRTLGDLARAGNPAAQTQLAIWYLEGIRVEADHDKARRLLSKAAACGFAPANFQLGCMYEQGLGFPESLADAVRCYTAAAEQADFFAQISLGRIYAHGGNGVPANCGLAARWYGAAADQEDLYKGWPEWDEAKRYLLRVKTAEG